MWRNCLSIDMLLKAAANPIRDLGRNALAKKIADDICAGNVEPAVHPIYGEDILGLFYKKDDFTIFIWPGKKWYVWQEFSDNTFFISATFKGDSKDFDFETALTVCKNDYDSLFHEIVHILDMLRKNSPKEYISLYNRPEYSYLNEKEESLTQEEMRLQNELWVNDWYEQNAIFNEYLDAFRYYINSNPDKLEEILNLDFDTFFNKLVRTQSIDKTVLTDFMYEDRLRHLKKRVYQLYEFLRSMDIDSAVEALQTI